LRQDFATHLSIKLLPTDDLRPPGGDLKSEREEPPEAGRDAFLRLIYVIKYYATGPDFPISLAKRARARRVEPTRAYSFNAD
jgi:hypothetical protein